MEVRKESSGIRRSHLCDRILNTATHQGYCLYSSYTLPLHPVLSPPTYWYNGIIVLLIISILA